MPSSGDRLADRYRIVAPLGAGGMATVHRAVDERLEREVALKILLPNHAADPALAARFEREARAMATAAHPGVVAVFDVDPGNPSAGREPFFVMELCSGGSLASRLTDGRRLSPDELVPILVSVADGLDGLHRSGLVHRDVKPSNILFAADRAKLGDLGLAQMEVDAGAGGLTAPGTAVGTLGYLAPELLRGERAGPAADVYALATVAYLALTGRLPRSATSVAELVSGSGSVPALVSTAHPELGTSFDQAIAAGLAPNPQDRPDALSFSSALTTALGRWARSGRPGLGTTGDMAVAAFQPRGDGPTDDATTAMALPMAATAAVPLARQSIEPAARPRNPSRSRARPGWVGPAAAFVAILLAVAIVGPRLVDMVGPAGALPGSGTPSIRPSRSPAASSSASLPPSPSPSAARSPSPSVDPARGAIDAVDAAITRARGGPDGLKGKEANDLQSLAARVRADLDGGDRTKALKDARALDDRIRRDADHLRDDDAARLKAASSDLLRALGG